MPTISIYLSGASRSLGNTWIFLAPLNFFMWARLEAFLPIRGPANLDGKERWTFTCIWNIIANKYSLVLTKVNFCHTKFFKMLHLKFTWQSFFTTPWNLHKIIICITTSCRFKCVFLKWLTPLDVVAWRLSLFLWALLLVASESVLNNFGFIRFEKGETFWKETSKRLEQCCN